MTHLVEFPLEDGSSIVVEVTDQEEGRGTDVLHMAAKANRSRHPKPLSKIRPATGKVINTLRGLVQRPDEIEMEFGFSLSAAASVIIASASTAANYKVILRRKGSPQRRPSEPFEHPSLQTASHKTDHIQDMISFCDQSTIVEQQKPPYPEVSPCSNDVATPACSGEK